MLKRIISAILVFCTLFQMVVTVKADGYEVMADEDFGQTRIDKLPDERWIATKNDTDYIGAIMYRDSKALKIEKGAAGDEGNTGVRYYLPKLVKEKAVVSANVMPLSEKINFAALYIIDEDGKSLVCCTFNNAGQIGVYYNNQWNYNTTYNVGSWYELKADIDFETNKFDFYVNGELVADDVGTRSTGKSVSQVYSYITTVNKTAYIKSLRVEGKSTGEAVALPEPDEEEEEEENEYIDYSKNVLVFEDNFNSYQTGEFKDSQNGWTVLKQNTGTVEVVSLDGGNKAVMVKKPENSAKGVLGIEYITDNATAIAIGKSVATLEYRIKNLNSQKFVAAPYVYSRVNTTGFAPNTPALSVGYGNQGFAYINTQSSSIGAYNQGEWYNVRLVMDFPAQIVDVYVNDVLVRTNEPFRNKVCFDLKRIRFYVEAAGAEFMLDDLKVTSSDKDMPEPADEAIPVEKQKQDTKTVYTITDTFIARRMSNLPPVIADIDGEDKEEIIIKADGVARLAKYNQPMILRCHNMRLTIPETVFKALDNGKDFSLFIDKAYDTNAAYEKLSDKVRISNTGVGVRINVYSGTEKLGRLPDVITVKLSDKISGDRDNRLVVVRVNDDGTYERTISKHDLLSEGIVFTTDLAGDFLAVRNRKTFSDTDSSWAKEYIEQAASRDIISGYTDGSFNPTGGITRGEAAVMLANAIGLKKAEYDEMFYDMDGSEYSAPYVAALYFAKIIDRELFGDAFYPEKTASREDISYLVMNTYYYISGRKNEELTKFYVDGSFTDIESAEEKMRDYIKSAYVLDFMNGYDGLFRPKDSVTRAEMSRIVVALLQKVGYMDSGPDFRNSRITDLYTFPFTYKSYQTYIPDPSGLSMNENGAVGFNVKYESGEESAWYIEEQRAIEDYVVPEIVRKHYLGNSSGESEHIEKFMKAVEWGFLRQDETGGFEGTGDEYHSAFFYLEEVGRILLLMKESGDPAYEKYLDEYIPKLKKSIMWTISDEEFMGNYNKGYYDIFTHRYFYYGAALLYAYKLTGDEQIREKAHFLILEGISRMTKEGILPEKYGFDVGYGVTSIHCAARCMMVCDDSMIRSELKELLVKSTEFIINKLDNKGNVDISDSTRVGHETKRDHETLKTVSERSFYNTLLAMASISETGDFIKARDQMAVRQGYLTSAYMEYRNNGYDLTTESFASTDAVATGRSNLRLTELPVKAVTVSDNYGKTSNPLGMFTDDTEDGGWYARNLPLYMDIDLGLVREIGKADIMFAGTTEKEYTYSVMISEDGINWKYAKRDCITKPVTRNTVEFDYTKARYVRIWVQRITPMFKTHWFTDIRGVRIYGVDNGESFDFEPVNTSYIRPVEY